MNSVMLTINVLTDKLFNNDVTLNGNIETTEGFFEIRLGYPLKNTESKFFKSGKFSFTFKTKKTIQQIMFIPTSSDNTECGDFNTVKLPNSNINFISLTPSFVKNVDLSNNSISSFNLATISSVEYLNLKNNKILLLDTLSNELGNGNKLGLSKLKVLDVSENKLSTLILKHCSNLTQIDYSDMDSSEQNLIVELPEQLE